MKSSYDYPGLVELFEEYRIFFTKEVQAPRVLDTSEIVKMNNLIKESAIENASIHYTYSHGVPHQESEKFLRAFVKIM